MGVIYKFLNKNFPNLARVLINTIGNESRWENGFERMVIRNLGELPLESGHKSIVFFSTHKSGSSIANHFLKKLIKENELKHINYDAYLSSMRLPIEKTFASSAFLERGFRARGYYYGCFRSYRAIPNIEKYNVIILLRDPRDVIVSHYYNVKSIKKIRTRDGLEERKMVQKMDVNQYVSYALPRFKNTYLEYLEHFRNKDTILFTKFEKLIEDSEGWLLAIATHFNLSCSNELLAEIGVRIYSKEENAEETVHHRRAKPGEYKEKLLPETIVLLNKELRQILVELNYNVADI